LKEIAVLKTKYRARTKLTLKAETIQHLYMSQLQYINGAAIYSPEPLCSAISRQNTCTGPKECA
jgi:hypothetical protein